MEAQQIKSLKQKVSLVAHNFFKARNILSNYASLTEKNTKMFIAYIKAVERAYEQLDEKEKKCLNNEYFYNGQKEWWRSSFSEKEFECLHNQTVIHFMEKFYATLG